MGWWRRNFVRVEHTPSGMTATSDASPSLFACKKACMAMLKGKLWSLERAAEPEPTSQAQAEIATRILARHRQGNAAD